MHFIIKIDHKTKVRSTCITIQVKFLYVQLSQYLCVLIVWHLQNNKPVKVYLNIFNTTGSNAGEGKGELYDMYIIFI